MNSEHSTTVFAAIHPPIAKSMPLISDIVDQKCLEMGFD